MTDGMSSSHTQLSSASSASTSPTKLCSKTYKKASQLYLTRRLPESLASLQPIITVPSSQDEHLTNGDHSAAVAPIATAPSTWRIKVWNLYITLLSAIVDLGAEEGKSQFGQKEWKAIATQVREGGIWETVVQVGYRGREGSVDAEVVYNLSVSIPNSPFGVVESSLANQILQGHSDSQSLILPVAQPTTSRDLPVILRATQSRSCRSPSGCIRRASAAPHVGC